MKADNFYSIGLVVTGFDKGGLEQVVYNLYLGYKARGWNAYILCEKSELVGYFATRLLDYRDLYIFSDDRDGFLAFCYRHQITHLHYHYQTFFLQDAFKFGIKTLYTIHNTYIWFEDDTFQYYGKIVRDADAIVAVSSMVKKYFCRRGGVDLEDITVISNGINPENLDAEELPQELSRSGLEIAEGHVTLCIPASISPAKQQIGMVGVMEEVIKEYANVTLLMVGNVGNPCYQEELISLISASPAKRHIKLIPFFDHRYMGEFLRKSVDIFMLPTLYEGCSNAVLEAAYCAKPMILTDVGNARDMLDKAAVTVVPPAYDNLFDIRLADIERISRMSKADNLQAVAQAVAENIRHLDTYKAKAETLTRLSDSYSYSQMVNEYCKLIESL